MAASRRVLPLVNAVDPVVTKFLPAITPLTYRFHVWKKAFRVVVAGGVLCGVLDLTAAFVVYGFRGAGPIRIRQSITAGLIIHIFCVGLPIALVVSGYEKSRNALYKENFL